MTKSSGFRDFLIIVVGAGISGSTFAMISYFFAINNHAGSTLGPLSDWWFIVTVVGCVFGFFIGGLSSTFIVALRMKALSAAVLNGLVHTGVFLLICLNDDGVRNSMMDWVVIALIPTGIAIGAVVAFLSRSFRK